jgi:catechol 2,3-dioxygenase-like lactoylglutathione lyase family enzyme
MLRKIDCVMLRVEDLAAGVAFYTETMGLQVLCRDETSVGLGFPETDAELVLHTLHLPPNCTVYYLVDNVTQTVATWPGRLHTPPFEIEVGWCAILEDPFTNPICILDLTKGPRRQ